MNYIICDTEVFAYDWIADFKMVGQDKHYTVHNTPELVKLMLNKHPEDVFVFCNNKHYDNYIIKAICCGFTPQEIKAVNDYIIGGNEGWNYKPLKAYKMPVFNYTDLFDDSEMGFSLKGFEGHMFMDIEESEVDFNLDRKLTEEELNETIKYCRYDVDATEQLFLRRKPYLESKISVGKMAGLTPQESLKLTNTKLTAKYLQASRVHYDDERDYKYPNNLRKEYIQQEVFDFFNRLGDKSIPDEELFKTSLIILLKKATCTLGFGGIHADVKKSHFKETEEYGIINADVGSYYPHLVTINGYSSRAMAHPEDYAVMLDKRMKAKASDDKETANALKLVCNSTYGAYGDKFNDLYDPLMMRSVCISGQLYLLELASHCLVECDCEVIQLNTDGIMLYYRNTDYDKLMSIFDEWQSRTGFDLEFDSVSEIYQKDVNNYTEIQTDGSIKVKGGYLVRGIAKTGAFKVNNNMCIVAKALQDYFTQGVSPEYTILNCDDIFQYQIIAKITSKYTRCFQLVNGKEIELQKCNRVYASKDFSNGTLYKVHHKGGVAKMPNLPEHCVVDNSNKLSIEDIDKRFYIDLAWKQIKDFIGK